MGNHGFDFMEAWLCGKPISEENCDEHIFGEDLDLGNISWLARLHKNSHHDKQEFPVAVRKALKDGLPPLPPETIHFVSVKLGDGDRWDPAPLTTLPGTNLWENLDGETFHKIHISSGGSSLKEGLNRVRCRFLTVENIKDEWTFRDMPRLGEKKMHAEMSIKDCSASGMHTSFAEYLEDVNQSYLKADISGPFGDPMGCETVEALLDNFERGEIALGDGTVQHGFMDRSQKAKNEIFGGRLDVLTPDKYREISEEEHRSLMARRDTPGADFIVVTTAPPFRRTEVFMEYQQMVCWRSNNLRQPLATRRERHLRW